VLADFKDNVKSGQATASGEHVITPEGATVELHKAAEALNNALNLNGVAALQSSQTVGSTTPNVVHVVVGRKAESQFSPPSERKSPSDQRRTSSSRAPSPGIT
jgi:nicotinate-nucleotide pyrophosphorylase